MYQSLDAERGETHYDPVADTFEPRRKGCRKTVWVGGLAVCGLVGLSSQLLPPSTIPQSAFDANSFMPKGNSMSCLQSACNSAVAAIAMKYDDVSSKNLTSCLTYAANAEAGKECFSTSLLKSNPEALNLYICGVCKQCIAGRLSPERCASLPQGENDLRGPPQTGIGGDKYGFDYSPYTKDAGTGSFIPGTTSLWTSFLTELEGADIAPIPSDVIPAVSDDVDDDLDAANEQAKQGLAQADISAKQRRKIENKIDDAFERADRGITEGLQRADDAIAKANANVERANIKAQKEMQYGEKQEEKGLKKADDQTTKGLTKADNEITQHVDNNPNVPSNVPGYIPTLSGSDHPVSDTVHQQQTLYSNTGGQSGSWSKYLDEQHIPRDSGLRSGGDPLEYSPWNLAVASEPQDKRHMNACMQMNCNSAIAALGSGVQGNPQVAQLSHCIQGAKTPKVANGCFKKYPCQEGTDLQMCMICKQCLPGDVDPERCAALPQGPNDIRGPY